MPIPVIRQLRDAYGLRYEAVNNYTFARHGFSAATDEDALKRTEDLARQSGHSHTLYRSLPMNKIERVR